MMNMILLRATLLLHFVCIMSLFFILTKKSFLLCTIKVMDMHQFCFWNSKYLDKWMPNCLSVILYSDQLCLWLIDTSLITTHTDSKHICTLQQFKKKIWLNQNCQQTAVGIIPCTWFVISVSLTVRQLSHDSAVRSQKRQQANKLEREESDDKLT